MSARVFALLIFLAASALHAAPLPKFSGLVVFGDSLSDTGNFSAAAEDKYSLAFPGPLFNYAPRRFTDGPLTVPAAFAFQGVWHQQLARLFLKMPGAKASASSGLNFAFADATTAAGTGEIEVAGFSLEVRNLGQQVEDYLDRQTPDPAALHIVWCGSNDLLEDDSEQRVQEAADHVLAAVQTLAEAGARQFLVMNLPPLGSTPRFHGEPKDRAELNGAATRFNTRLKRGLDLLESKFPQPDQVKIYRVNVNALFRQLLAQPAASGLVNVRASAQGEPLANPDRWLFWDEIHPTTAGHHLLAVAARKALRAGQ